MGETHSDADDDDDGDGKDDVDDVASILQTIHINKHF